MPFQISTPFDPGKREYYEQTSFVTEGGKKERKMREIIHLYAFAYCSSFSSTLLLLLQYLKCCPFPFVPTNTFSTVFLSGVPFEALQFRYALYGEKQKTQRLHELAVEVYANQGQLCSFDQS